MKNVKRINESQLKAIITESVKKVLNEMQRSDDPEFWERMTNKAGDQFLPHPSAGSGIYGYFNRNANPNGQTIPNPEERIAIQRNYRDKFNDNSTQAMMNVLGNCRGINYEVTTTKNIAYYSTNGAECKIISKGKGQFEGWYCTYEKNHGPMKIYELVTYAPAKDEETANALAIWVQKFHSNDSALADYANPQAWMGDFSFKYR